MGVSTRSHYDWVTLPQRCRKTVMTDPAGTLDLLAGALDLPARSRFGEGRVGTFEREALLSVTFAGLHSR